MPAPTTINEPPSPALLEGIVERTEHGLVILSPATGRPHRRVLFVNSYGGAEQWRSIKKGDAPPHHLWGCVELLHRGYEVALAEPLPDFYLYRRPLPHDLKLFQMARQWVGRDGIVYCGHNVLYWLPLLRRLHLLRCAVVSLLFAREPLALSQAHAGIIALTGAAADHAQKLAPQAKVAHLGWGGDLQFFPRLNYRPEIFLSCGRTFRDFRTLNLAASRFPGLIRIIAPNVPGDPRWPAPGDLTWPANVELVTRQQDNKWLSYQDLLHAYYARAAGALIITRADPQEQGACGFTNLIEAMAMARPVILTRTGALGSEIDIEKENCGLFVPPEDPAALAWALQTLADDPARAAAMGENGRRLCENHYNMTRFGTGLHQFFESL